MADGAALRQVVKDMALRPEDFFRGLPAAMAGRDYRVEDLKVISGGGEKGLEISIKPLPPRRLGGLLALDHCEVVIAFIGFDAGEEENFLKTFDRAYQRAGG